MEITGSLTTKMDDNTVSALAHWLAGTSKAILVGDEGTSAGGSATKIFFSLVKLSRDFCSYWSVIRIKNLRATRKSQKTLTSS